jgi:prephenate dehydrogenase
MWGAVTGENMPAATVGPVHVVGAGLLGASIGLGLRAAGVEVTLDDVSPLALAVAVEIGAGCARQAGDCEPRLIIVAVPPDMAGGVVLRELAAHPQAVVTDVTSVKATVLGEVAAGGGDLARYVGSHPMAGRERNGPAGALPDLCVGRPWVIADSGHCAPEALAAVRAVAIDLGAMPVQMPAERHDAAMAVVSHAPQLVSSLVAARLDDARDEALDLAGQGVRDVTRIAASDSAMWAPILLGNAAAVADVLKHLRCDLDRLIDGLTAAGNGQTGAALMAIHEVMGAGNAGVRRIPGKHGGSRREWDDLTVMVPDEPGELGRLFNEVGSLGVSIEDLRLEHAPGQPVGLASLSVAPGLGDGLAGDLERQGWRVLR